MNPQFGVWVKIWSVLIVVFALGCVTGAAINGLYRGQTGDEPRSTALDQGEVYFESLKRELDLSDQQAARMRAILDETRAQYKDICAEVRPRYYNLRENARIRMRELLSEDQAERFDRMAPQEDC
ncbi:MAG TPA: periplasmic heavy metal sensor, partial [Blastocatellia bacterium]|nr:periplasmic heavy metal sensor [Blastocatellia bacterium]